MAIAPMNCTAPHVSRRCRPPAGRQCQDAPCILHSQLAMHACVVTCTVRQEWHCMSGAAEQYSDARMAGRAGAGALAAALGKRTYRGIVRVGTIDVEVCIEGKGCRMRGVAKVRGDRSIGWRRIGAVLSTRPQQAAAAAVAARSAQPVSAARSPSGLVLRNGNGLRLRIARGGRPLPRLQAVPRQLAGLANDPLLRSRAGGWEGNQL